MAKKCYICQKNDVGANGFLCDACEDRRVNPPHVHKWEPFKFSETSNVTYYSCSCGEQRMTAKEAN